jgi:hypothetical protein
VHRYTFDCAEALWLWAQVEIGFRLGIGLEMGIET